MSDDSKDIKSKILVKLVHHYKQIMIIKLI